VLLLVCKFVYVSGCTSGWYGTTAHIQESHNFLKQSKGEIIEQFGAPDSVFSERKESLTEYWLYRSHRYSYVVLWGEKKEKGVIFIFKDNIVNSVGFVDKGELDEIATRGWKYLKLLKRLMSG
jgi:hypothetical protein